MKTHRTRRWCGALRLRFLLLILAVISAVAKENAEEIVVLFQGRTAGGVVAALVILFITSFSIIALKCTFFNRQYAQ